MKHSIKRTFTLIFVAIVAALLLTMYIVNRFFLQSYYLDRKIGEVSLHTSMSHEIAAVVAALSIAEELFEAQKENQALRNRLYKEKK